MANPFSRLTAFRSNTHSGVEHLQPVAAVRSEAALQQPENAVHSKAERQQPAAAARPGAARQQPENAVHSKAERQQPAAAARPEAVRQQHVNATRSGATHHQPANAMRFRAVLQSGDEVSDEEDDAASQSIDNVSDEEENACSRHSDYVSDGENDAVLQSGDYVSDGENDVDSRCGSNVFGDNTNQHLVLELWNLQQKMEGNEANYEDLHNYVSELAKFTNGLSLKMESLQQMVIQGGPEATYDNTLLKKSFQSWLSQTQNRKQRCIEELRLCNENLVHGNQEMTRTIEKQHQDIEELVQKLELAMRQKEELEIEVQDQRTHLSQYYDYCQQLAVENQQLRNQFRSITAGDLNSKPAVGLNSKPAGDLHSRSDPVSVSQHATMDSHSRSQVAPALRDVAVDLQSNSVATPVFSLGAVWRTEASRHNSFGGFRSHAFDRQVQQDFRYTPGKSYEIPCKYCRQNGTAPTILTAQEMLKYFNPNGTPKMVKGHVQIPPTTCPSCKTKNRKFSHTEE